MAYFEVAVMCAEEWIDGWDSLSVHTFVFFYTLFPNLAPPCMHLVTAVRVCLYALPEELDCMLFFL